MKGRAGKLMYETLKNYGVTHFFGMDEPIHLYQELDRKVIRPITIRDEKHGVIMAHGYAKVTNKPGICTAIQGPGATNLVPGLAEALKSSTPVIAIVGDVVSTIHGRNAHQEIDHEGLLGPVVKWVGRLDNPNRVAEMTRTAFRIATSGRPGPVALACPWGLLAEDAEAEVYAEIGCDRYPSSRPRASRESIEAAIDLLASARNPVIVAGGGCILSQAWDQVVELAEMYNIPVATTMFGKGTIPDSHLLSLGVMGAYTSGKYGRGRIANQIVSEADVVFIIGSKTDQVPYFDWTIPKRGTKIIHLDIDPEEIGRNFEVQVAMVGDVKATLIDLIDYCREKDVKVQTKLDENRIKQLKMNWSELNEPFFASKQIPIRPERLLKEVSEYIDTNTILTTDASYDCQWVMSHFDNVSKGCNILIPRALAPIGWSLPLAMGAKIGSPGKTVFSFSGDGGFGYTLAELETAARYDIGIVVVIFNNSQLGFQKHYEQVLFGKTVETKLLDVDYGEVARALKCRGERIDNPDGIRPALERALDSKTPYVLDVVIDPNATPPVGMFENFNPKEEYA